jgi:hypothetical protein
LVAALVLATAVSLNAAPPTPADERLFAESDPFARAPSSFHADLVITTGKRTLRLEVYRRGSDRALVRFLDPAELGKFLIRNDREVWFVAPGSRRPIRLDPGHRLAGASLDELVGRRLSTSYAIAGVEQGEGLVTFVLEARDAGVAFARARHVVRRDVGLPLRTDLQAADGRVLRVVEYLTWRNETELVPELVVIKDLVRRGPPIEVRFVSVEAEELPDALFDLGDPSERNRRFAAR